MLLPIDPRHPEPRKVARAVEALEAGEVIGYPTDTVYGLGCDLLSKKGVDRLYAIKGMQRSHPLAFICPDLADIAHYAVVEKPVYRVLRHYLPGPYCFIVEATREVPKLVQTRRRTVGIRIPKSEVILAVTRALGRPVISTTARRDGEDPFIDPDEIDESFKGLAMVLDGGVGGMLHTTVIDLTKNPPEVLREGAGPLDAFAG
jgi:tRNA threonylcarbamoyl adenosine modification protein (Sua5/YciO/YrdC/YwlC family)